MRSGGDDEAEEEAGRTTPTTRSVLVMASICLIFVLAVLATSAEHQQPFEVRPNRYRHPNSVIRQVEVRHGFLRITVELGLEIPDRAKLVPLDLVAHISSSSSSSSSTANNTTATKSYAQLLPKIRSFKQQLRALNIRLNVYFVPDGKCSSSSSSSSSQREGGGGGVSRWSLANQLHVFEGCGEDEDGVDEKEEEEAMFRGEPVSLASFKWRLVDGLVQCNELDVRQTNWEKIKAGIELNHQPTTGIVDTNLFLVPIPRSSTNLTTNTNTSKSSSHKTTHKSSKTNNTFNRIAFWAKAGDLPAEVAVVVASSSSPSHASVDAAGGMFKVVAVQWRTVAVAEWFKLDYRHVEFRLDRPMKLPSSSSSASSSYYVGLYVSKPSIRSVRLVAAAENASFRYFQLARPLTQEHLSRTITLKMHPGVQGEMPLFNIL